MPKYIRRFDSIQDSVDATLYSPSLVDVTQDDESKLLIKDVEADDALLRIDKDDIKHIEISIDYLTMTANIASSISLTNYGSNLPNIEFSINNDNENWYDWKTYNNYTNIPLNTGDNIRFRGLNPNGFSYDITNYSNFVITGSINLSGNIMTLIDKLGSSKNIPNSPSCFCRLFKNQSAIKTVCKLPAETLYGACYFSLFQGTGITDISKIDLPAKNITCYPLWGEDPYDYSGAYSQMFAQCLSLTSVPSLNAANIAAMGYYGMFFDDALLMSTPKLSAMSLGSYCYADMFHGCTSLINVTDLPATELQLGCYEYMFYGCTSLTFAPILNAKTLVEKCYEYMFSGCTNLSSICCLATSGINTNNSTTNWTTNVAASGIFKKEYSAIWPSGVNGIPSDWTII